MSYKVDYHVHSWYSDGLMKPTELVRMYKDREYDIMALTDHDGVEGVSEAMIAGEALKIKVVPGIELSMAFAAEGKELELHILGYNIDIENQPLLDRLTHIREDRRIRNEKLLAHLRALGYDLTWEDLLTRPGQTYVGKPDFARALKRQGQDFDGMWEVFDQVKKEKISTAEGIDLIKGAGGIAVLAHPMKIKAFGEVGGETFWPQLENLLVTLKKQGLSGLECYHPSASAEDSLKLVVLAGKYHLHITEGSDFHGEA